MTKEFWANVRTISQELGYTKRRSGEVQVPAFAAIHQRYAELGLTTAHLATQQDKLTTLGEDLMAYFEFRAAVLNGQVQRFLMTKDAAQAEFEALRTRLDPKCPLPWNKQKGEKKNYAFLTCMVNMLVESSIGDASCDYDPRSLTTITHDLLPVRTLSRRVDGAFPSVVNPIAIWEVKEYYHTTTFGSRVADGVYETLLDGMELAELETAAKRKVEHLLVIDDHFTWWKCGRSYLCRIVDMLHMGYVDEVIFGREVLTRLPVLATAWRRTYDTMIQTGRS
jgi:hypothetical protein